MKQSFILLLLSLLLSSPISVLAQSDGGTVSPDAAVPGDVSDAGSFSGVAGRLIICNQSADAVVGDTDNVCDFNDLIRVANLLINLVIQLALVAGVLVLLIVGGMYLIAGSGDAKTKAKQRLKLLLIGFGYILGAYLIVNTLFAIAGVDTAFKFLESSN